MKTTHSRTILGTLAPAAIALVLFACGGEKQMHAAAPLPIEPVGQTNMQATGQVPNAPTASNVAISEDVLRACSIPDSDAYFRFDSSQLTRFDQHPLDSVAACFTSGPMAGRRLELIGHADPRGVPAYNVTLGQSRADAVSGYLTGHGMNAHNLSSTSRGAMDATGREETGWAHDRRVDVVLAR